HLERAEVGAAPKQVGQVGLDGVAGGAAQAADAGADRAGGAVVGDVHGGLDALLDRVGELEALGAEELDAVVGHGVVGGGDHRPGGGAGVAGAAGAGPSGGHTPPADRAPRPPPDNPPTARRPGARASSGVRSALARPRTPSVPNSVVTTGV